MEKQKKFRKYRGDNKKDTPSDGVVYRTKPSGPIKYEDWQLKLKSISACIETNGEIITEWVENKYQELLNK